jgi:hypothetical protein
MVGTRVLDMCKSNSTFERLIARQNKKNLSAKLESYIFHQSLNPTTETLLGIVTAVNKPVKNLSPIRC